MTDEEDKNEDAVKKAIEEKAEARVSFWKKILVATIPVLIPAVVSAGGISALLNWSNVEQAKVAAEVAAAAEAKKVDDAIKKHLDEKFKPEIAKMLDDLVEEHEDEMDLFIVDMSDDMAKCHKLANTADRNAYAALIGIGNKLGERRVLSALNEADRDKDAEAVRAAAAASSGDREVVRRKKPRNRKFSPYEQREADPAPKKRPVNPVSTPGY